MRKQALLPTRGLAMVPLLMLPMAAGGLWLAAAPQAMPARISVVAGAAAVGWYLLGGMLSAKRLAEEIRSRHDIRRARRDIGASDDVVWLVDPRGIVQAQTGAAARRLDLVGREVRHLVAQFRADPEAAAETLLSRAHLRRNAVLELADGSRLEAARLPGSRVQRWRLAPPAPQQAPQEHSGRTADFDLLPVALLELDAEGHVRAANRAAEALLGPVAPDIFLGDLLDGLGRPLRDWLAEAREGRDSGRGEVMHSRGEGPERHIQVTLSRDGRSEGLVAVLTDASAMKTLEAQFVQSQKMQAIGQLAGGIAHDFNNLLTAITGHCDLLMLRRDKADPDYADLHQISQNANRAAALVGQLLAFSRKQTLKPQILDLRDALSDLTHLLNRLVGERIVLRFTHDPSLRPIRADRRQLEQVIMNLIVNARDAMPDGGEIAIRTENLRLSRARAQERASLPRGDYVRVTVADQGCGIAPDQLGKIFDPFFTTKRPGEGTGLGLSTVYGIVKQTGGHIFCDSVPGQGTTFTLYFPAQKAERRVQPVASAVLDMPLTDAEPARRHTVLLVEDEAPVRAFASRALTLRGFEVIEADSAERALDILSDDRLRVDLFVTDVVMPGMDGPTWVRAALRDRPGTAVIFMSGYTELTLSDSASPIPGAILLPKPFSLSELVALVERQLARPDTAQPASSDAEPAATPSGEADSHAAGARSGTAESARSRLH